MRRIILEGSSSCFFLVYLFLVCSLANAQADPTFELKNGDRVVFLGNALVENEQFYNYLEYRLTRHWPDRSISFRNLGWSGDNVFGDARSLYTSPPTSYELLISQLTDAKPTLVLLGYGGVEAYEGQGGLNNFSQGLIGLMEKINELGSEVILLSPIPQFSGPSAAFLQERTKNLQLYAKKIEEIAKAKGKRYINALDPLTSFGESISDDGVHLNEIGYYQLSAVIEKELGLVEKTWEVSLDFPNIQLESNLNSRVISSDIKQGKVSFSVEEEILPVPYPAEFPIAGTTQRILRIKGLKKGYYTLEIDGKPSVTASAKAWGEGIALRQGGAFDQATHLRQLLNKKDEVFFFQYRPLNETYIIGFRKYEQGRHQKDLDDFDAVLNWLQGQITAAKAPKLGYYHLYPAP